MDVANENDTIVIDFDGSALKYLEKNFLKHKGKFIKVRTLVHLKIYCGLDEKGTHRGTELQPGTLLWYPKKYFNPHLMEEAK